MESVVALGDPDLFVFNDTATTEIYTLSLHAALPISTPTAMRRWRRTTTGSSPPRRTRSPSWPGTGLRDPTAVAARAGTDRKSTRLNSSHANISYAVFCLKKKKPRSPPDNHPTDHICV